MTSNQTPLWTRNPSDRLAVANGCTFDPAEGAFPAYWIERHCRLYEGSEGEPLILRGCHQCREYSLPAASSFPSWDAARPTYLDRAARFLSCLAAGHPVDWQFDCTMRLFGWRRHSDKWDGMIRRFREAVILVAKKNKKTPTTAAWALYLLMGDGEEGQKVFIGAADGAQARKTTDHAKQMILHSPDLMEMLNAELLRINETTMRISYTPTTSYLEPMSSNNKRSQKSKEGLNGSICIDELHVVDREFMSRTTRAGISRREPLRIEVSTAGDNPDSYGRERFDHAMRVQAGKFTDQELFAAIYAAPQDATDEQIAEHLEEYGHAANPAWGHTIDPEEFRRDHDTSKAKGAREFSTFKMYRLNIWQKGSDPWLRSSDWSRCRREFTEADLAGLPCAAGLDLSRKYDLSALVLVFPWENDTDNDAEELQTFRLLHYYFMPEATAKERLHLAPFTDWARAGYLTLTPGDVIHFGAICEKWRELCGKFDVQELAFDPKFAHETAERMCEGLTNAEGKTIEEGTGTARFVFAQTDENFAAPTDDYERFVRAGTLHHDGNPVAEWQAGHATVQRRTNKVLRVCKESSTSYKSVDGIVAGIMGLARAQRLAVGTGAGGCDAW